MNQSLILQIYFKIKIKLKLKTTCINNLYILLLNTWF